MMELIGKKVWVERGNGDGFTGRVERANGKWIYVAVDDPSGGTAGIWLNLDLQREVAVLND